MKKLRWLFVAIIVLTLLGGILHRGLSKNQGYMRTEFLFDTQCSVQIYGENAELAATEVFDKLKYINDITNMYDENSQISAINNAPENYPVEVSNDIIEMLKTAQKISSETDGKFDLTVAAITQIWDFKANKPAIPNDEVLRERKILVDYRSIAIDEEKNTVNKLNSDTMIDLGGIAKGYAADVAAMLLKEKGVVGAVIDLGGNIVCVGENPKAEDGYWRIGIQVPFKPTGEYDEVVKVKEGAVVTSGTYQRYFEKDGKLYHHIIDPETGYPADMEYSSVTITAKNALLADCLATACFVIGRDAGKALARSYGADILYQ